MRNTAAHRKTIAIIAILGASVGISAARAQDASAWDGEAHAPARLIAGSTLKSAAAEWARAGIEIRLDPGWKTYWRYPGDSGVPPTLNFSGSDNVKSVTALWPAPQRFDDGAGGFSIGYRGDVVLPLRIVTDDPSRPASLHLKLNYALCSKMCLPAEAELVLDVSGETGAEEPVLAAAEARVPRRVPLGGAGALAITSVRRETGTPHDRVVVEVNAPAGASVDLFAEGPTPDWTLPLPEPNAGAANGAPGTRAFVFDLDGLPPGATAQGAKLILTAVTPTDAIEVEARLD